MDTASSLHQNPIRRRVRGGECVVDAALDVIGGKWKGMIVYQLLDAGPLRFNALRREVGDITQRMLTKQLRELEDDGLVSRTVYAEVPPRVEYRLTPGGAALAPVIAALKAWGESHLRVPATREAA
ncbi:helix-turn-helix domain-containing protein [Brevundimonas sp.]|uniref:winged helix-turn-helix transcriptional regulator n=1 Tax=Brevundimonas sp. TaxID=1871086 RepID=UPI0027378F8F|nr:helix-turn-helix domain-containing protein [Brevundimonas sp.]MDP3803053.1 helix-turn-helix domain-containing protein [Brevundimonas sp.]